VQKITQEVLFSFWSFVGFALIEVYEAQRTNYQAPQVNNTPSFEKTNVEEPKFAYSTTVYSTK
jgi:hypothetical protein